MFAELLCMSEVYLTLVVHGMRVPARIFPKLTDPSSFPLASYTTK